MADWLYVPEPNPGAHLRLVCFPHAGSGAFGFRNWPRYLPRDVEVCAVQLPGRENRLMEPPICSLPQLVSQLVAVLEPVLKRPFALFGHSMGALVAFELARALRRDCGLLPEHLFVSARVAPQLPPRHRPMYSESDAAFVERLRQFNGTADAILNNSELMRLFLPVLKADFQLNEAYCYTPEAPLQCPITRFGGALDRVAPIEQMAGWSEHTTVRSVQHTLPGDHFFVQSAQDRLCQAISEELA